MSNKKLSRDEWSEFWKNDTLTTFLGTFGRNYDGEIKEFWDDSFSQLPDNAKIIDLATGNGALAFLAMQYSESHSKDFSVTGIDYADINPNQIPSLSSEEKKLIESIEFLSNSNIETTNLADNYYDCAISQYGIEYSNLEKTIPELKRILKANSIFSVIVHHTDSIIIKQSSESLEQIDICLKNSNLESLLLEIIDNFSTVKSQAEFTELIQSENLKTLRSDYNLAIRKIASKAEAFENKWVTDFVLSSFSKILGLAPNTSLKEKLNKIEDIHSELKIYTKRTEDLLAAALNEEKFSRFEALLLASDFKDINITKQYYKNTDLIGFSLTAKQY